jgi:hypothetical protein
MARTNETTRNLFSTRPSTHVVKDIVVVAFIAAMFGSFIAHVNNPPRAARAEQAAQRVVA